jgi:hypothetical protein
VTSVKEPAKLMELQSEYAKNAYETFMAEAKRLSELYADLFKQMTKPFEDLIAKNKAAWLWRRGEWLKGRSPLTSTRSLRVVPHSQSKLRKLNACSVALDELHQVFEFSSFADEEELNGGVIQPGLIKLANCRA